MSDFLNLTEDLPRRCKALLEAFSPQAEDLGLEVTFLLSIASLGFLAPYDILKGTETEGAPLGPNVQPVDFQKAIDATLFVGSIYDQPKSSNSAWRYGKVSYEQFTTKTKNESRFIPADDWDGWDANELTAESKRFKINKKKEFQTDSVTTRYILDIIRNALAHGNIRTTELAGSITRIVFLSHVKFRDPGQGFEYVGIDIKGFRTFLTTWLRELESKDIRDQWHQRTVIPVPAQPHSALPT